MAKYTRYVCPTCDRSVLPWRRASRVSSDTITCASCRTRDCIRGRDGIPGCELQLFLPRKAGNMDCTTCLDCVHACPHDNVGLVVVTPGKELWRDPPRSGIGRFGQRPDVAALALVLVFGAFANAAGALCCETLGAQPAMPTRAAVRKLMD